MTPSPSAAETIQQVCYQTHPSVVPADAICLECLTLALDAERQRVWEAAATICQRASDEPMTGNDEHIHFAQVGVKLALGVLAIEFLARAAAEGRG
jgi:hypothetical protein